MISLNEALGGRMSLNRVYDNGSVGLYAFGTGKVLASGNVLVRNSTAPFTGAITPTGDNMCNTVLC